MHDIEFLKQEAEYSNGNTEKLKRLFSTDSASPGGILGTKEERRSPSPHPLVSELKKPRLLPGVSPSRGGSMTPPSHSGGRGLSPAPILKGSSKIGGGGTSLLNLWNNKNSSTASSRHQEFHGRREYGNFAKLYVKEEEDDKNGIKEDVKMKVETR